jgi:NodT family efflux transporter outer membrane factor (OMF) lipoprotein
LAALLCTGVAGCLVGPNYKRPAAPTSPVYKEAAGWAPAQPSDAATRSDWWTTFGDPTLNDLEARVVVSNQNLAAAEAAYRVAHDLVAQDRAALFPTVTLNASPSVSHSNGNGSVIIPGGSTAPVGGSGTRTTYNPSIGASWAPDIWGAVRRTIENARDNAQASAATLANARLSAQTELAVDYITLRQDDEQKRILDETVAVFTRTVEITRNKYNAGVSGKSDLLSAQTQLDNARASDTDLEQQRARMEHAIAILAGEPPADLTLAPGPWTLTLPAIPASLPSTLLQRRPDIASAERSAAAANASIGVAVAAYYPTISLSAQDGFSGSNLGNLFSVGNNFWALGGSAALTLFDAGERRAKVRGARAAYDEAVANYRQTVLTALGQVEDNLAAQRVFEREEAILASASQEASANSVILKNEYLAGTVDFTAVIVVEAQALQARTALAQIQANRLTTAVDLIEALGGGWTTAELPKD